MIWTTIKMSENEIINISSTDLKQVRVQDETMYLLGKEDVEKIINGSQVDGMSVANITALRGLFSESRQLFCHLAIIKYHKWKYLSYMLYEQQGEYFRTNIQNSKCMNCGWMGQAIAPAPDYFNDSDSVTTKKWKYACSKASQRTCPNCRQVIVKQPCFKRFDKT